MFKTKTARRVVIIVDATLEEQFLEKVAELGAKGYNITPCKGKGIHSLTGDPFDGDELVRIEVIATDETAVAILDHIHAVQFQQFGQYAIAAFTDTVEVDERDRSLI